MGGKIEDELAGFWLSGNGEHKKWPKIHSLGREEMAQNMTKILRDMNPVGAIPYNYWPPWTWPVNAFHTFTLG